ncbi:MAG TPA: VOC family protein [Cyclobacteriaceae bacterium]|nr:VOC family protein [Cyclobacteriaceae bacterium]HMV07817.1 VOC family protein [Cyclobacteriaceae bacterium]HMV88085.1 VOC family protein [Cyclobacteriaceae bacterium]HMW98951.1 VOC family protein [Cyclobacteriaceae bacterium]HMX48415.1 VOC family protein [Cyclobacteriaceae bacterium]
MTLEHVAIWTTRLDELRDFYVKFFNGTCSAKYINPTTRFESYFIRFDNGARLELMKKPEVPENLNNPIDQYLGIIHIAFAAGSMAEVDRMCETMRDAGCKILRGPRKTGDGYYEFETLDPDNNRLEICSVWSE